MNKKNFLYNLKLATICGMLVGAPVGGRADEKSVWDKIESTPMSEKLEIAQHNLDEAHRKNIQLVKYSTRRYIQTGIKDTVLADFMDKCILSDAEYYYWKSLSLVNPDADNFMRIIKSDYKWFDDLMKYLSGRYTDAEFYKTGFFKTVKRCECSFSVSLYDMARWRGFIERNSKSR